VTPQAYERRCQRIAEIGCLACAKRGWFCDPDVHHLNLDGHAGQQRIGNEATIGLCPWHHRAVTWCHWSRQRMTECFGPSLALEPDRFRQVFGSDDDLLRLQNELIAEKESNLVGAA
jgi:hypothetical protein